jgi:putative ABC transport system permease protein
LKAALQRIKTHWLHTVLSVIGIMVGVLSIITLLSVSEGISREASSNIKSLGLNTIKINTLNNDNKLNLSDYSFVKSLVGNNGIVASILIYSDKNINYLNKDFSGDIYFSNHQFLKIENLELERGREFFPYDIQNSVNVAIVSSDLAKKYNIKINKYLRIKNTLYKIIGISSVHSKKNNFVYIPLSVNPFENQYDTIDVISIFIKNKNNIFTLASLVENRLIEKNQNIKKFEIIIPLKIIESERRTYKLFSLITLIIAVLSLITGGVSVMNVMLSNITEQTREIGLRSALGATPKRIVQYYLIYAALMTSLGGVLGITLGYLILFLITMFSQVMVVFSFKALIVAFFISIFSGIIFGLYPALRASKIEPIVALKDF